MRAESTAAGASLATWYLRRLSRLAVAPCRYGRWDTVNAYLATRGLIADTGRATGANRREYAITEAGHAALAHASDAVATLSRRRRASVSA